MFHLAAFWENIDQAGVLQPLTAAAGEQVLFTTGDEIRVPDGLEQLILAAGIVGQTDTRALLVSPSLRDVFNVDISPLNDGTDGDCLPSVPQRVVDLRSSPIALEAGESLTAETNANQTDADDQSVLAWLSDGPIVPVTGVPIYALRATAAITAIAGSWTNGALTFLQTIPVGNYQVVGLRGEGVTLVGIRLVFRGGGWRPGVMGSVGRADEAWDGFRNGGMGVFGEFHSTVPPTVDVLCNDADTAQRVILDLVKVS
jgi:hypothetical protein